MKHIKDRICCQKLSQKSCATVKLIYELDEKSTVTLTQFPFSFSPDVSFALLSGTIHGILLYFSNTVYLLVELQLFSV